MIFSKLSLIYMFKDISLAENWTKFGGKSEKKLGSAEPVEPAFYNSELIEVTLYK